MEKASEEYRALQRAVGCFMSEWNMNEAGLIWHCSPESVPREPSRTELNA